jgi:LPXTG-motif cell wall-anchored protein
MGKLKVVVGAACFAATVSVAGIAVAQEADYVPVEVEGAVQSQGVAVAEVSAVQPATTSGQLPYTGNDSSVLLAEAGVGLLAVGGAAIAVARSRRVA